MAKRQETKEEDYLRDLGKLSQADRQFLLILTWVIAALGDPDLGRHKLPPRLEHTLRRLNRDELFSVMAECLSSLLRSSLLQRMKQRLWSHEPRAGCRQTRRQNRAAKPLQPRQTTRRSEAK
jgi:hypothetical protein